MIAFPNAKINLGLNVVEKRADGFHNIQSVFYPVGLCDMLEMVSGTGKGMQLGLSGLPVPGSPSANLLQKTYDLLARDHTLPAIRVHLHKVIPMGAGLGGGSSDAAFFLQMLNEGLELNLAWGELHHYARQLGSDCSFFVTNRPVFAEGKGDEMESLTLDLSGHHLCIIHPGIHVDTAQAYAGLQPVPPSSFLEEDILELPVTKWKGVIKNDFEPTVFKKYPAIQAVKEKLYAQGALYASMSGSGSAVYGIFKDLPELKKQFPGYFYWEAKLAR